MLPRSLRNDTASAVVTETGCIDMPQTPLSWIGCRSFRIAAESGEIAGRRGEEGTEATETACLEMIKTTGSLPRVGFVPLYGSQTPSFIVTARVKNLGYCQTRWHFTRCYYPCVSTTLTIRQVDKIRVR